MTTEYVSEIHRLLKLGPAFASESHTAAEHVFGAPLGLPIEHPAETVANEPVSDQAFDHSLENIGGQRAKLMSFLIYPIIFVGAFAFFYIILNFSALTGQVQGLFIKPQNQQALGNQLQPYYQWIEGYYYTVNDMNLLDPNNDIDKDGLSNMDEFIMHTNPIVADSDSDGFSDGVEVINGMNPWGAGAMSAAQKDLAAKLDMNTINNRITFNSSPNHGVVSAAETSKYDLNKPGVLSIPKLNIQVPLIWSKDPSNFETDLTQGVIHYPGTALPGEVGTIYVSGHSSDYLWKHDAMATIFTKLNYLKPGDDVFVQIFDLTGTSITYRYQVTGNAIFKPDDQMQFIDNSTNKLNLSTCWPIGTSTNRLVVSAVQVGL